MRAITGAVISSEPCGLRMAAHILSRFAESTASHLPTSDCTTYVRAAAKAAFDHHSFRRELGVSLLQDGEVTSLDPRVYGGQVKVERKHQGRKEGGDTEVPAGGSLRSVEEAKVAVATDEKKSKKRKKEGESHVDEAVVGVASHIPGSPEILSEQRKKKEKHSNKELVSVVKQEHDLVVEEDGVSERKKKKKEKHSDKDVSSIVKQEPGLVVEDLGSEKKKKDKKNKEKGHVKLEEGVVEAKGQIVNNGVAEQEIADGEKKRKKKKHSQGDGDSKGAEEEKMGADGDLNSERKKKKKRDRGDGDADVQQQGEHKKKKQRTDS